MQLLMVDLRTVETGLTDAERREAVYESRRMKQREALGDRWVLHPSRAPQKGTYNPLTGARLG